MTNNDKGWKRHVFCFVRRVNLLWKRWQCEGWGRAPMGGMWWWCVGGEVGWRKRVRRHICRCRSTTGEHKEDFWFTQSMFVFWVKGIFHHFFNNNNNNKKLKDADTWMLCALWKKVFEILFNNSVTAGMCFSLHREARQYVLAHRCSNENSFKYRVYDVF